MVLLETLESLKTVVALVLAYCMIAGIAGAFQAWVARVCGDDTGDEQGMMTINPFVHIDPLSLLLLPIGYLLFKVVIGLSKPVPIDWRNIHAPWRRFKITCVAGAQPVAILSLLVGLIIFRLLIVAGLFVFGAAAYVPTALKVYSYIFGAAVGFSIWFIPYQALMSIALLYVYEQEQRGSAVNSFLILMLVPLLGAVLIIDPSRIALIKILSLIENGLLAGVHALFA